MVWRIGARSVIRWCAISGCIIRCCVVSWVIARCSLLSEVGVDLVYTYLYSRIRFRLLWDQRLLLCLWHGAVHRRTGSAAAAAARSGDCSISCSSRKSSRTSWTGIWCTCSVGSSTLGELSPECFCCNFFLFLFPLSSSSLFYFLPFSSILILFPLFALHALVDLFCSMDKSMQIVCERRALWTQSLRATVDLLFLSWNEVFLHCSSIYCEGPSCRKQSLRLFGALYVHGIPMR